MMCDANIDGVINVYDLMIVTIVLVLAVYKIGDMIRNFIDKRYVFYK